MNGLKEEVKRCIRKHKGHEGFPQCRNSCGLGGACKKIETED